MGGGGVRLRARVLCARRVRGMDVGRWMEARGEFGGGWARESGGRGGGGRWEWCAQGIEQPTARELG